MDGSKRHGGGRRVRHFERLDKIAQRIMRKLNRQRRPIPVTEGVAQEDDIGAGRGTSGIEPRDGVTTK